MALLLQLGLVKQAVSSLARRCKSYRLSVMVMIMISLVTVSVLVSVFHVSQAMEFFYVICQPQMWAEAKQFLTQPVLFLLVNLVVLSIWISSGAASNCHSNSKSNRRSDAIKEAKVQSPGIARNGKLASLSFSNDNENKAEPSVDCDLQASKLAPAQALSSATNANEVQKQGISPDRRVVKSGRSIVRSEAVTKKCSAAATKRTKFQGRTPSLPSRVVVSNVSARETEAGQFGENNCKQEVLVMEVDELNERIDAFFARFRERMRQESLRCQ